MEIWIYSIGTTHVPIEDSQLDIQYAVTPAVEAPSTSCGRIDSLN